MEKNKESENYILDYDVLNDEIYINFASGKKFEIPYTIENEKKLLKKIEEQFSEYKEKYIENLKKINGFKFCHKISCVLSIIGLGTSVLCSIPIYSYVFVFFGCTSSVFVFKYKIDAEKIEKKIENIDKYESNNENKMKRLFNKKEKVISTTSKVEISENINTKAKVKILVKN